MTDEETPYHEIDAIEEVMNALVDIHEKTKNQGVKDRARAAFQIMDAALLYSKAAAALVEIKPEANV